jgi:hypothetical protein
MISISDADTYFSTRLYSDKWTVADQNTKKSAINTAEIMLTGAFDLRVGYDDPESDNYTPYFNAVCEQSVHMLQMDKERRKLKLEGVSDYTVDDMSFKMSNALISPIAKAFLKPIIYKKVGNIV